MTVLRIAGAVARALLATGLVAMGVNHFRPNSLRTMAEMIPPAMRGRGVLSAESLVRLTGACEIAGGVGMLVPATRPAAGGALVLFFAAVFPANVRAAALPDRFGKLAFPLVPRLVAQVVLIVVTGAITLPRRRTA